MDDQPHSALPPAPVHDAFGVRGARVPLPGGQGRSVRVGGYVFKPAEEGEARAEWAAALSESLATAPGFRVPQPLRTPDGRVVVEGWTASGLLPGRTGPQGHWDEVLRAGRALHAALRHVPRPAFLARRTDPWAVADRVAWGERELAVTDDLAAPYARLRELIRPVTGSAAQLVHGDLTGNVLLAPGAVPAVIDFSPYWRPPLFAEAVVVADGLLWYEVPPGLVEGSGAQEHRDWRQMLVRALLFRLVAHSELVGDGGGAQEGAPGCYARAAEVVARRG